VANELIQFNKRARVEQFVDALAGGHLALGVLLLNRSLTAGGYRLVVALLEVCKFARGSERVNRICFVSHGINPIEACTRHNVSMSLDHTRAISPQVVWLDEIGSTNTELARRLATDSMDAWPHLSVLATDTQTAGKGRLGRVWTAPAGASLAASVLVRPGRGRAFDQAGYGWLPLIAGTAMASALARLVPGAARIELKWPNDVQIDGLKVCGILTELQPDGSVIIGSGVNLSLTADQLPTPTSTSLALAGANVTVDDVLSAYLAELAPALDALSSAGGRAAETSIPAAVAARCNTIGQSVRVELPTGEKPVGTATGIDDRGCLIVETSTGESLVVAAGDVTHLRVIMKGD
jgi:BirA family biotin operon repressor/biotin-[acetyl-CoA-carboxylase] ligase